MSMPLSAVRCPLSAVRCPLSAVRCPCPGFSTCPLNSQGYETTLFPQAISVARRYVQIPGRLLPRLYRAPSLLACYGCNSFDRQLVYKEARAISDEVRGKHNDGAKAGHMTYPFGHICWAPVVNLCRDRKHIKIIVVVINELVKCTVVYSSHHFAGSAMEAAEFCLKAGCDWNCGYCILAFR